MSFAALAVFAGLLAPVTGHAATLTWWSTGSTGSEGGAGTWNTSDQSWTSDGTTWQAWTNPTAPPDTAVFAGTSGTVTLGTGITVGGLTFSTTGYTVTGNTLTLSGGTAALSTNANATTITSVITGTAILQKLGSGTLTLSGSNTYSGGTVIDAGAVVAGTGVASNGGNSRALGLGNITVNNALITSSTTFAVGGGSSTTRTLTLNSGTWNLGFPGSEYVRNLSLTAGLVTTSNTSWFRAPTGGLSISTLASSGTSVIAPRFDLTWSSLTLDVADGDAAVDLALNGQITQNTGAGGGASAKSVTKSGAGTVLLSASNTYTGGTVINAGVVSFAANALGTSGTITINGGALQWATGNAQDISSRLALVSGSTATLDTNGNNVTLATGFGGSTSASLVKAGAGTLTLSGNNSYSGGTVINAGVVSFAANALGSSGTITMNGGALQWAAGNTLDISPRLALVSGSTATLDTNGNNVTLASGFGAGTSGAVTKAGSGRLTLAAANTYTGATTITGGTLALSGDGDIASSSGVNLSAAGDATLDISAASGARTILSLEGVAGSSVLLGGNTLTANNTTNKTFAGVISGSGSFTKAGAGVLTLTDAQAFTGTARVDAGTLAISGSNTLATANRIYVASGASLDATAAGLGVVSGQTLGGYGTVSGNLALLAGGTLSPGGSVGTLSETGNTTWNGGMHYLFEVNVASGTAGGPNGWDLFNTSGSLTLVDGNVSPIAIDLTSLSGTSGGSAADFNPNFNYAWKFVVAGSEITTFNAGWFTVNSSDFENLPSNPERFYVARGDQMNAINASGSSNELYVVYAAVPEPTTLALAAIGIAAAVALRRRKPQERLS